MTDKKDDIEGLEPEQGEEQGEQPVKAKEESEEETIESLREELEQEREKVREHLEQWKRSAAEFSNFRKRNAKERDEIVKFSNALLITKLLPILDDFDRAFQTLPVNMAQFTWVDGIALVQRKLEAILQQEGLSPIEATGKPFDPNFHQAVIYEDCCDHEDGTILNEMQKGYMLKDRILRPTLVKVAKKVSEPETEATKEEPGTDTEPETSGTAETLE